MKKKEAMKILKDFHDKSALFSVRTALDTVLPELAESGDESIRKSIIGFLITIASLKDGKTVSNEDFDSKAILDWVAWLEKQGEQKFEQKFFINDKVVHKATGKIWTIHYYLKDTNSYYVEDNDGLLHHYRESELKLVEQKPADKVEPKFEIGNWVVCGQYGAPCQIESIKGGRYYFTSGIGIPIESVNIDYHLWTLQDAKDGDVLIYPDGSITLFKYMDENIYMAHVLWVDGHIELNNSCAVSNVHPATKEQRNLLFQKMKDEGYEWDADKKELKKIEQKPWSEEDEAIYYGVIETEQYMLDVVNGIREFSVGNASIKEECTRELDWLKSLKDRVQPKQEWSEEDENWLFNAINVCELNNYNETAEWLKSLRPQSQWRPSDEQMELIKDIVFKDRQNITRKELAIFNSIYNDLMKL